MIKYKKKNNNKMDKTFGSLKLYLDINVILNKSSKNAKIQEGKSVEL